MDLYPRTYGSSRAGRPLPRRQPRFGRRNRFLIEKTEEAIRDGMQLRKLDPFQRSRASLSLCFSELGKELTKFPTSGRILDNSRSTRKPRPVMGCIQTVEFGGPSGRSRCRSSQEFVFSEFSHLSHWNYRRLSWWLWYRAEPLKTHTANTEFSGDLRQTAFDGADLGNSCWVLMTGPD